MGGGGGLLELCGFLLGSQCNVENGIEGVQFVSKFEMMYIIMTARL
jgi:hypothetical protein